MKTDFLFKRRCDRFGIQSIFLINPLVTIMLMGANPIQSVCATVPEFLVTISYFQNATNTLICYEICQNVRLSCRKQQLKCNVS